MYENLYENLSYKTESKDLNLMDKQFLVENIHNLNTEQREILYYLCLYHYNKTNPQSKTIHPYKMKQNENILEIKIDALDNRLKHILLKFIKQVISQEKIIIPSEDVVYKQPDSVKRRGRKPKYRHTVMLKDIVARDLFNRIKHARKHDQSTIVRFDESDSIRVQPNEEERTKILDFNFDKKQSFYMESGITRHIQMIDHISGGCLPHRTDIHCWHDRHEFTTSPIGIPIKYIPKKYIINYSTIHNKTDCGENDYYITFGIFCSFSCALAYIKEHASDPLFRQSKSLLYSMYYKLNHTQCNENEAPHWQCLESYGGHLTIDDFREKYCTSNFEITDNIKRPYMVAVGKFIEQKKCNFL